MSELQHQRIVELCQELRLSAVPNLYSGVAQSAATKEASFADFLEETLRAERDARSARAREMFARVVAAGGSAGLRQPGGIHAALRRHGA